MVILRERQRVRSCDAEALRQQFPILSRPMRGLPLVFLDNASTTQKPQRVIDAEARFYATTNANIHRGVYELSEEATAAYVAAHEAVARFIGAAGPEEIIFTRNATEGLNLIAWAFGQGPWGVGKGRGILLTAMEHHSNIVPWQQLARRAGANLRWVELTPDGRLDMDDLRRTLDPSPKAQAPRPKVLAVTHVSNVLGTVNPMGEIVAIAHDAGVPVVVDAAQSVGRMPVNVRDWDADFVVFSAHKMYGPTGVGVVYGKRERLEVMEPFLTGGDMVKTVTRQRATWNDLPWKFEAGTPNIAGGVAFGETIRFLSEIGMENVWAHEQGLVVSALPRLQGIPGLRLLGPPDDGIVRSGVFSFALPGIHSHDLASFLDERGIAIRGGHHCAQPLLATLGLTECARASVGLYTTTEDIDRLMAGLEEARSVLVS